MHGSNVTSREIPGVRGANRIERVGADDGQLPIAKMLAHVLAEIGVGDRIRLPVWAGVFAHDPVTGLPVVPDHHSDHVRLPI